MTSETKTELSRAVFPVDFRWGVATASYQIEGAVHQDGRGPSIWDTFSHTPGKVENGDNGDVACDHYNRYSEDIALMVKLGINSYRFSMSWPRIFPEGTGKVNQAGLDFYSRLVDELLAAGIEPYATLYHWDLPQALEDQGGWSKRDTAYYFAEYADTVSRHLGDRVKGWITLNEPGVSATLGYLTGEHAPGLKSMNKAIRATHHLLLAHGLAIPRLRQNATRPDAELGITLSFNAVDPGDENARELALLKDAWDNRLFLDPIFKGVYPGELFTVTNPHLPVEPDDMAIISTPVDFLGVNYYFRTLPVEWADQKNMSFKERYNEDAPHTVMGWEVHPEGLYKLLSRLHNDYRIQKIYITENGAAYEDKLVEEQGELFVHDPQRLDYLQQHFQATLKAIQEGAPVAGYFIWSLLDNFEWAYGYDKRFGIVYVDYPTQRRVIKDSGRWYQNFLAH
jgi:beta-glucosidase